ncbi:type I restriction enzyme endonuclease domain-containing protein [Campylobacter sp. MIT 12-5580]|nr:type I restriction enzyme endonuclease domain-containing protein [Campylobacter sp. MIT 12-5580]
MKLRIAVRKVLREFGYPPDIIKITAENAIKQAELIAQALT